MRIIGLWNPDHHTGVVSNNSTFTPNTSALYINDTLPTNLLTATVSNGKPSNWAWYVMSALGRNWLRILPTVSSNPPITYYTLCPALNASQYTELRAQGVKRVYYGLRVYAIGVKSGANLIVVTGVQYYPITTGNVYFVEAVINLEDNTRTIYVNGAVVPIPVVNDLVAIGNYNGSMLSGSSHSFGVTDYYFATSEAGDAVLPARLGKMTVGTALPVSTSNDSKFKAVGRFNIVDTLALARAIQAPNYLSDYVESDSNGSKMNVMFAAPTTGNEIFGVTLRVAGMKDPAAQAFARVDYGSGMKNVSIPNTDSTLTPYYHPFPIDKPTNGWSEAELGKITVKLWSERTV